MFLPASSLPTKRNFFRLCRAGHSRKNYLFIHHFDAGSSITGLYSLVATCEARGINPFDYLTDVLARVQDHPSSAVDELLPATPPIQAPVWGVLPERA